MSRARSFASLLVATTLVACSEKHVVRAYDGEIVVGRYIPARAYQAYALGAIAEADGRLEVAAKAYEAAATFDADGPEAWTRLGAVRCRSGQPDLAEDAFARAERALSTFAPLHRERARCALLRNDPKTALHEAELATVLDPLDLDAQLALVDALVQSGEATRGARVLFALLLEVTPPPRAAIDRLEDLAGSLHDDTLAAFAARARRTLALTPSPDGGAAPPRESSATLADVDTALSAGDLPRARILARRAHISQGDLALRAAALGLRVEARAQAELVANADPRSASSRVAWLASLEPGDSPSGVVASFNASNLVELSRLGRLVLVDTLARWVGDAIARPLLSKDELETPSPDPLEERVRLRLYRRWSKSP
ncbi:MAG: hypothetical protein U0271_32545 [Polyangiaceae bacterium]